MSGPYKYSIGDSPRQFISCGVRLVKIGEDEPRFGASFNLIDSTYDLVQFFFDLLKRQYSNGKGFWWNRNIITRNLDKVHLLIYQVEEEKYFLQDEPKFSTLIPIEEYQDLVFTDAPSDRHFILLGWALVSDDEKHVKIHIFDTFLRGHNFGELLIDKIYDLDKSIYISDPLPESFDYWAKHDFWLTMFPQWCDEFIATPEESDDVENKRFKKFVIEELQWDEWTYRRWLDWPDD